jgi:Amidohydrolase family
MRESREVSPLPNRWRGKAIRRLSSFCASISQWIRAGVVIGMGTDSGTPLNFHRDALWREAKVLVDHGMSAARVITALTLVYARILGKERELGTIEPGKLADITVVKGNPLFDIVALGECRRRYQGRRCVSRFDTDRARHAGHFEIANSLLKSPIEGISCVGFATGFHWHSPQARE